MIRCHQPVLDELWFRESLMSDPETMSYNHAWGGTIPFPEQEWKDWYDFWITNHGNRRFYRYLKNPADRFVGEIACHFDERRGIFLADVIIKRFLQKIGLSDHKG